MKVPASMQALVTIAKLEPNPGDSGQIDCPKCGKEFNWWKEKAIGKLSGSCASCGLRLPRA